MSRWNSCRTHRRAVDPSARRNGDDRHQDAHSDRHILLILTQAMAHKTGQDLIDEAKQQIEELTPEQVRDMQARNERAVYLDVREPNEWNLGRLPHAIPLVGRNC